MRKRIFPDRLWSGEISVLFYHPFFLQKEGRKRMRSVKDSSRPISMDRATTIFVMAGMADQLQVAPNCPRAGPELLMVAMERPRAEGISAPLAAIRAVHKKMDIV